MSSWLSDPNKIQTLNCYPVYPSYLDVYQLHLGDADDFCYQWLDQLLNYNQLKLSSEVSFAINQQLEYLYYESKNTERLQGVSKLGFGFPIYSCLFDEQLIFTPIFIWPLQLNPDQHKAETWHYQKSHQIERPYLNPAFLNLIEQSCDIDPAWLEYEKQLNAKQLVQFLSELHQKLNFDWFDQQLSLRPCPALAELDPLTNNGKLVWSGVLGNFPLFQLDNISSESLISSFLQNEGHPFQLLPLHPDQAAALETGRKHTLSLFSGSSGTGKTYTLAALAMNALANGEKALVVSDCVESLIEIQAYLSNFGLNHLNFLLKSPYSDRVLLLELLKAAAQNTEYNQVYDAIAYDKWLEKTNRLYQKYHSQYTAVHKNAFGTLSWTETVGLFLKNNREEGKELLSSQLNPTDFSFQFTEYKNLLEAIEKSRTVYQEIQTLNHPLISLNPRIFTEMEQADGLDFVGRQTEKLSERTTQLHQRYINKSQAYNDRLFRYYEAVYQKLFLFKNEINELIAENTNQFGSTFVTSSSNFSIRSLFSSRVKAMQEAKDVVFERYIKISTYYAQNQMFEFDFPAEKDIKDIQTVKDIILSFEEQLEEWRSQIPTIVQQEMNRLNHKTVAPQLGFKDQMEELELSLDRLVESINASRLFRAPLKSQMLTIPKRQKHLEAITERIETIQFNLRDFNSFYQWQRHWLQLSEEGRKVVRALIKVKVDNWEASFTSWYLNNCLLRAYQPILPQEELDLGELNKQILLANTQLLSHIKAYWHEQKEKGTKRLRKKNKTLFNRLFSKNNQELNEGKSLREGLGEGLLAITDVIPIFFSTSPVALQFSEAARQIFDYVILDEAQELPAEVAQQLLQFGKRGILLTDLSYQLPAESAIASYRDQNPNGVAHLYHKHRIATGNVLDQLPAQVDQLNFKQVDGRFDEQTRVNEAEAQEVIRILNQVQKTPQLTYPRVGIACFTVEQRNLILHYLQDIKRRDTPGADKIKQLERNGLGIFSLEELFGQHFDILIVSNTFGIVDLQGKLSSQIELLEQREWARYLRIMMSRSLQELFILNSIPKAFFDKYLASERGEAPFLLAAFNEYASAAANGKRDRQNEILNLVQASFSQKKEATYGTTFAEEISRALRSYVKSDRIKTNVQAEGYHFPVYIEPLEEHRPAIVCKLDGFWTHHQAATDFRWEYQHDLFLEKSGYEVLSVFSAAWWKSPDEEARKLGSAILKLDAKR